MDELKPKPGIIVRKATLQETKSLLHKKEWFLEDMKDAQCFVAVQGKKVIGAIAAGLGKKKNEGIVRSFGVFDKNIGREKIEHRLLGKAHAFLMHKGVKATRTDVMTGEKPMYARAGYAKVRTHGFGTFLKGHEMIRLTPKPRRRI